MSLIASTDHWGCWSALAVATVIGNASQKTAIRKVLSGEMMTMIVSLSLSNAGIIPFHSSAYDFVSQYLLPMGIPLLLFKANIRRVIKETGKLLGMFCIGSFCTIIGTIAAMKLIPLNELGEDGWKIASALASSYIGGSVNFVSTSSALETSSSVVTAALAADNILCASYFALLFLLAKDIAPDPINKSFPQRDDEIFQNSSDNSATSLSSGQNTGRVTTTSVDFLLCATALAVSSVICAIGTSVSHYFGCPGYSIPLITLFSTFLATCFPGWLIPLSPSGEGLAGIIINVFLASVGASGSVVGMLTNAPSLFLFCFVQVGIHLLLCFLLGGLFGYRRRDILLASNANVGGPTTAVAMAVSKGWRRSYVPSMLVGTFGYAVATFVSVALGLRVLRYM